MLFNMYALMAALLAGLFALWSGWRIACPRLTWPEAALLGLLAGCAGILHPGGLVVGLCLGLGVAAVWPGRALGVMILSSTVMSLAYAQQALLWPAWPPLPAPTLASGSLVLLGLLAYQFYYWRWWAPLRHLQVGLSGWALLVTTATVGAWPLAWSLSALLAALPLWAWWLVKVQKKF